MFYRVFGTGLSLSFPHVNKWRDFTYQCSSWITCSEYAGACLSDSTKSTITAENLSVCSSLLVSTASGLHLTISCEFTYGYLCLIDMHTHCKFYLKWKLLLCGNAQPSWELPLHTWSEPWSLASRRLLECGHTTLNLVSRWQNKNQTRKCTAW